MNESDLSTFCEPVYKGFIDPTTVLGVPMIPFLVVTTTAFEAALGGFFIFGVPVLIFTGILYVAALVWARSIGATDIQRLHQLVLRAKIRQGQGPLRRHLGAISYGPTSRRGAR